MKIGLYYCHCGMADVENAPGCIDVAQMAAQLVGQVDIAYIEPIEFVCSASGQQLLEDHLRLHQPDRVLMTVCSVRDHEETMRAVLQRAGINPYCLQLVNVREHVAWVTEGCQAATDKAVTYLRAAARRVVLHEPLEPMELELCTDCLVIGGGPAGLKAALTLAQAGRRVTLVEAGPILGGLPVRFDEMFPHLECGPCMLEPLLESVLQAPNIEVLLQAEVVDLCGFFGNFTVTLRQHPRYVAVDNCIGCGQCIEVCPQTTAEQPKAGRAPRKAIDWEFFGGLPNVPFIETDACTRFQGHRSELPSPPRDNCTACLDACPVEDAIRYEDAEKTHVRQVGSVVVAVGSSLFDCSRIPGLRWGELAEVYDSYQFERMLSKRGPTQGVLTTADGRVPASIAIVHCVGSLDPQHQPYCSSVCCLTAFKFNHLIRQQSPGARLTHFYKMLSAPGKDGAACYQRCVDDPNTTFVPYRSIAELDLLLTPEGRLSLTGQCFDMVVLMQALVPSAGAVRLSRTLGLASDRHGFLQELHSRTDAGASRVRGIYLAGTCQGPKDMQQAMSQGVAAAGYSLGALVPGRSHVVSPVVAVVEQARCASCRTCIPVCSYKAIGLDAAGAAYVNPVLCVGCGACVAACPAGVMQALHFTDGEILAEIEELLR